MGTKLRKFSLKSYDGEKFGRLTILKDCGHVYFPTSRPKRRVLCLCECGTEKELTLADIKSGKIESCGCKHQEIIRKIAIKHGMKHTRFYNTFLGIKRRCNNKNEKQYKNYGGRGIKCEFPSFESFYNEMFHSYSDNLTIERIDVNGNYNALNCTWITRESQARNKRNTIRYKGEPLIDYCEKNNLSVKIIRQRMSQGWDIEKAINTKVRPIIKRIKKIPTI